MSAKAGIYDTKAETLVVKPDIVLKSSNGYEAYLSEASVDIRKGNIVSEKPVSVKLLNGTLNSNRLEITNAGEVLKFDGGVTMMLDMSKSTVASQSQAQPEAKTP
jgi:lipopolysaccharide export system protein LptC